MSHREGSCGKYLRREFIPLTGLAEPAHCTAKSGAGLPALDCGKAFAGDERSLRAEKGTPRQEPSPDDWDRFAGEQGWVVHWRFMADVWGAWARASVEQLSRKRSSTWAAGNGDTTVCRWLEASARLLGQPRHWKQPEALITVAGDRIHHRSPMN